MKKGILSWVLGLAGVALIAGCGGSGGGSGGGPSVFAPDLMLLNAIPDSGSASFSIDGSPQVTGLKFLANSPAFKKVEKGERDAEVFVDGSVESSDARVINFSDNESTILGAIGLKNFGTEYDKRVRINRFVINRNRPNGERARIYVLHALIFPKGQYIPQLEVKTPGKNPQASVPDIGFTNAPILDIDSGAQTLIVRRNGTELEYLTKNVTLEAGGIYMAVISGVIGQTGAKAPTLKLIALSGR